LSLLAPFNAGRTEIDRVDMRIDVSPSFAYLVASL
jgi:hypothetical protein